MDQHDTGYLPSFLRRPVAILVLLGTSGALLSLYAARQESEQFAALERLQITEAIDAHFGLVQDHLTTRQNLAAFVSALFVPPPLGAPRPLGDLGSRVVTLAPDISTVGWLPEVTGEHWDEAIATMRNSGIKDPRIRSGDGKPIDRDALDRPAYPIIDVAPKSNRWIIGVDAGSFPDRLEAIQAARDRREVARTEPLRLVQAPDADALLLYAPVFGNDGQFRGVMGFGYKTRQLLASALMPLRLSPDSEVRVFGGTSNRLLFAMRGDGTILDTDNPDRDDLAAGRTVIERTASFADRDLRFVYIVQRNVTRESLWRGVAVAGAGLGLTACAVLLIGFISGRATALANEVRSRRSAEDRLKVVIHELNHRVRNVLSVAQAVVRLSFTPGLTLGEVQRTCEGRLLALANAMSLLTASDWKGIRLRELISADIIPFAERVAFKGPDIALKARAAQTFALLLHELATNAAKHGAFSVPSGRVTLEWEIDRSGTEPLFRFVWREMGGPEVTPPKRRGFGELLVRRIAPRDISGRATVNYEAQGFCYVLEAPLHELIDASSGRTA